MYRPAFNRTDRPLLIDAAGREIAGLEWGPVDSTSEEVRSAEASGWLVVKTDEAPAEDASPEFAAAHARAGVLEERRSAYSSADADAVRAAARAAELDDSATKSELVAALVYVERDPGDLLAKPKRQRSEAPTLPTATSTPEG